MKKQEKQEYIMHVENLYDTLMNIKEERGISYGEIAYVESLKKKELEELEEEIIEELERIKEIVNDIV